MKSLVRRISLLNTSRLFLQWMAHLLNCSGGGILTTQSLLFGFSIQKNNGLEGEIVAEKKENREERAVRRGSRPCSHEP